MINMLRILLFIIGVLLSITGLFFIILYLNLLTIGYSFTYFVYFIIRSIYTNIFFIGLIIIYFTLRRPK